MRSMLVIRRGTWGFGRNLLQWLLVITMRFMTGVYAVRRTFIEA